MPVIVNGVELSDADLEQELPHHADAANPQRRAITALVLRRVMLDEARRLGLHADGDEAAIQALLDTQARAPEPDAATCRRHYDAHPDRFVVGERVEADHILFQVTPQVNVPQMRARAEEALNTLLAEPDRFAAMAAELDGKLEEAEINPLFVLPDGQGVKAADGVVILR